MDLREVIRSGAKRQQSKEDILFIGHDKSLCMDHDTAIVKPYITADGVLVIPFDSDPKYFWWAGGQSIEQTLIEINASLEVMQKYLSDKAGSCARGLNQ